MALRSSNRLRQAALDVRSRQVDVARASQQNRTELVADPQLGAHQYLSAPFRQTLGLFGVTGGIEHQTDSGQRVDITGHAHLPTGSPLERGRVLAGEPRYGVMGRYSLPLSRNRFGREYRLQGQLAEDRKQDAEAAADVLRLAMCTDAVQRYVVLYVAEQRLTVYRALLKEKRRIWYQTAADYRKKMVSRLDLLAANSDWLAAKSREPGLIAAVDRAVARLQEYQTGRESPTPILAEPTGLSPGSSDPEKDPRFIALLAQSQALAHQEAVIMEANRSELDLGFSLGVDRFHNLAAQKSDITDLWGMLSLRYVFPLKRPQVKLDLQLLTLSQQAVEQERIRLRRQLRADRRQAQAAVHQARRATQLVSRQIKVARQQIRAAYREFRSGKLQFQAFLTHWERYQTARLALWDARRDEWLAEAQALGASGELPALCR